MLLKLFQLTFFLFVITGFVVFNPIDVESASFEEEVVSLINYERQKQNIPPLSFSEKLFQAATNHNNTMVTCSKTLPASTCLSHQVSYLSEASFFERIKATGYNPKSASENIAWGHTSPAAVVTSWMKSSGHRTNIMGNFKDIGCDYIDSQNGSYKGIYWTCDFGVSFNTSVLNPSPTKSIVATPTPIKQMSPTPSPTAKVLNTPTPTVSSSTKPWWCVYAPTYYLCK